jgi:hypothetical protein
MKPMQVRSLLSYVAFFCVTLPLMVGCSNPASQMKTGTDKGASSKPVAGAVRLVHGPVGFLGRLLKKKAFFKKITFKWI